MTMWIRIASLAVAVLLSATACVTVKTLQVTGGSRADGMVYMSYDYGLFERPNVQWEQGQADARDRCRAWGYSGATPFGGSQSRCIAVNAQGGCVQWRVTLPYQCTTTSGP